MKKILLAIGCLLVCGAVYSQAFDANGASKAEFSVSPTKKVRFSKGNLQYQASTGTWRFAEHQYDCIGEGNKNISSTYEGWIDLFGWGTSGWSSGADAYKPYHRSKYSGDYWVGGAYNNSLTGEYAQADWGVYNAISNGGNKVGMWRTLTAEEWNYILFTRRGEGKEVVTEVDTEEKVIRETKMVYTNMSFVMAVVCGVKCLVLFPDGYKHPAGLAELKNVNDGGAGFSNSIGTTMWEKMERAGCVALPAAGHRLGTEVSYVGTGCRYWSSTYDDALSALGMNFYDGDLGMDNYNRLSGRSVRLVRDSD